MREIDYIPNDAFGPILYKLVRLMGYRILIKGVNVKGNASYTRWALVKDGAK